MWDDIFITNIYLEIEEVMTCNKNVKAYVLYETLKLNLLQFLFYNTAQNYERNVIYFFSNNPCCSSRAILEFGIFLYRNFI